MSRRESYSKEDLINSGLGKLFGAERGKLPAPPMLMMDRITAISETGGTIQGEIKLIESSTVVFDGHFTGLQYAR